MGKNLGVLFGVIGLFITDLPLRGAAVRGRETLVVMIERGTTIEAVKDWLSTATADEINHIVFLQTQTFFPKGQTALVQALFKIWRLNDFINDGARQPHELANWKRFQALYCTIASMLLDDDRVDVNKGCNHTEVPLYAAIGAREPDFVHKLFQRGAKLLDVRTRDGRTPWTWVLQSLRDSVREREQVPMIPMLKELFSAIGKEGGCEDDGAQRALTSQLMAEAERILTRRPDVMSKVRKELFVMDEESASSGSSMSSGDGSPR